MAAPESAYAQVERLVKKFKGLAPAARKSYNEAETRKDFILPLFRALEWNIDDAAEVSAEEKVSRGWVDFAFRLSGIPRFFLETKKIAEDLTDPRWVKQAIDYAWTKSVAWALLSDFEGLRVFNAEWKEENPLRAQFLEFSVDTYLSDFERLWWLSKPEIAAGTLDREAEKVGKKTRKEPVSQHLFDDLKEWRRELFRHLSAYNKRYLPAQIDEAVLRILNRLIFIRTAEDRGVEPPRLMPLLRELHERGRLAHLPDELARLFREMDAAYDSDLFAEHFSEKLDCEPEPFRILIEGLHEKRGGYVQYNFNAIDADVLGTVYEQYLGHVITAGQGESRVRPEVVEKRAKRKSQGIFYTPTFVVRYIVKQTLGRYLDEHGYNPARPVRVLDMACGSGSFLIEAFDVLDRFLARQRGQSHGGQMDVHDHARRMEILTQCLYGVDKDEQAVAVAKLNLSLKALHTRDKLPMLQNIRVGDSLISGAPDELRAAFGKDWQSKKPFNWQTEFPDVFTPPLRSGGGAGGGGFDVIVGNPPYVRIQTLPKDEVAFFNEHYAAATGNYDIYVLFVERALQLLKPGGTMGFILPSKFFNTTYGAGLRKLIADARALWKVVDFGDAQVFGEATTYTCLLFLQKQANERFTHVPAGDWLKAQTSTPQAIPDDLPEHALGAATLSGAEWNFSAGKGAALLERLGAMPVKLGNIAHIFVGTQTSADDIFVLEDCKRKKNLIFGISKSLGRQVQVEAASTVPFLRGKDIRRYAPPESQARLICPYEILEDNCRLLAPSEMAQKFPLALAYLKANKTALMERERGRFKGGDWYAFGYPKSMALFQRVKIIVPDYNNVASFTLDSEGHFYKTGYGIILKEGPLSPLYVLGLLNSSLLFKYLLSIGTLLRGGYVRFWTKYIERLPIRRINFSDPAEKRQHDEIVKLVEEMLQLQKDYAAAEREKEDRRFALKRRIDEVDAAIDRLVYNLYGLTEAEIRIVEGRQGAEDVKEAR